MAQVCWVFQTSLTNRTSQRVGFLYKSADQPPFPLRVTRSSMCLICCMLYLREWRSRQTGVSSARSSKLLFTILVAEGASLGDTTPLLARQDVLTSAHEGKGI